MNDHPVAWQSLQDPQFITTDPGLAEKWKRSGYVVRPLYADSPSPYPKLTNAWFESARFDASVAINDKDGSLTGCIAWCRAFAEIVLRHGAALSGKSEAAPADEEGQK